MTVGKLLFGPPSWEDILPTLWDRDLPLRERRTGPYILDSLDQPHLDIVFNVNAARIPLGQLGSEDMVQVFGFDTCPGELLSTSEVEDGLYEVTYRFDRPPRGWPFFGSHIALSPEFRPLRELQQPGAILSSQLEPITGIRVPENLRPPVIPLMKHGQADALSADTFELSVDFVSEHGVDLASIGDGDLSLLHERRPLPSGQDDRLLQTEVKEDGKRITAVYQFCRDPNAVFSGTWIKPYSPRGAVMDLAGNATPGGLAEEWEFNGLRIISQFNVTRQMEDIPEGEFDYGFIPLSPYHPDISEYHFRVVYKSARPIDLDDFVAHPHLAGETQPLGQYAQRRLPDLHPTLRNWRSADSGRLVEADYVIEHPEWGWPRSVVLTLIQQGIRDIDNRVPLVRENLPTLGIPIADLGGNIDEAIRATVLSGHEVSAQADTHRIAVLLEANERLEADEFTDALTWFGWHPELLPGIEDFDLPFPAAGEMVDFFKVSDDDIESYDLRVFFNRPAEELPQPGSDHYDIWIDSETILFRDFARDGRLLIDRAEALSDVERDFIYTEAKLSGRQKVRDVPDIPRQTRKAKTMTKAPPILPF